MVAAHVRWNGNGGVGKVPVPTLQTVLAVFPHTAPRSLVSPSGVSCVRVGSSLGEPAVRLMLTPSK